MPRLVLDEPLAPAITPGAMNPLPQRKAPRLVLDTSSEPQIQTGKPIKRSWFKESAQDLKKKAENIMALAKQTGMNPLDVEKNYDALRLDPKVTGIKHEITSQEAAQASWLPLLGASVAAYGAIPTALAVAISPIISKINAKQFLPKDTNEDIKKFVDIADLGAQLLVYHKVMKSAPGVADKLTKKVITEYNLPKEVSLTSKQVRDIFQTGELTTAEQKGFFKDLGLDRFQKRIAAREGIKLKVPVEKITTISDRPYWAKIKRFFGSEPFSKTISEMPGSAKVSQAPAGMIEQQAPIEQPIAPPLAPPIIPPGPRLVPDNIGQPIVLPPHLQKIADKAKGFTSQDVTPPGYGPEETKNEQIKTPEAQVVENPNIEKPVVPQANPTISAEDIKDFEDISILMGYTEPNQLVRTDEGFTVIGGGAPANFLKGETNKGIDRILYKIKNGKKLAPGQEEKFRTLLEGYRKEVNPILQELENDRTQVSKSEATEAIRDANKDQPVNEQIDWGDEEEPSRGESYLEELYKVKKGVEKLTTNELEDFIDGKYESGADQEVLNMLEDVYAERVSEENPHFLDELEDDQSEDTYGWGSLEEVLANMYARYKSGRLEMAGMSNKDFISNTRSNLEDYFKKEDVDKISDEDIISSAKEIYDKKKALLERIKNVKDYPSTPKMPESNLTPSGQIKLELQPPIKKDLFQAGESIPVPRGDLFEKPKQPKEKKTRLPKLPIQTGKAHQLLSTAIIMKDDATAAFIDKAMKEGMIEGTPFRIKELKKRLDKVMSPMVEEEKTLTEKAEDALIIPKLESHESGLVVKVKSFGREAFVPLVEEYKGMQIVKTGDNFSVWNPKKETLFVVALDDSKSTSGKRFINQEANNVETARKYIDWLTDKAQPTGGKAEKEQIVYQGKGRPIEEIYRGVAKPVLGNANYYALTKKDAAQFGEVTEKRISLKNPLEINNDVQWKALAAEAGWPYPNLFGFTDTDNVSMMIDQMKKLILSKGHDGVIITLDRKTDNTKTMTKVFGISQIVDYTGMEKVFEKPAELSKEQLEARDKKEIEEMLREEKYRISSAQRMLDQGKITKAQFDSMTKQSYDLIKKYESKESPENKKIAEPKEKWYSSDRLEIAYGSQEKAIQAIDEAIGKIREELSAPLPGQTGIPSGHTGQQDLVEAAIRKNEVVRQLKSRGFVDYRGIKVNDIEDVASIARLFRNPKIEQFQTLYFKNNVLVAHQVISSGAFSYAYIKAKNLFSISEAAKKLGADSVYFAHNHPSGNPAPSDGDILFTKGLPSLPNIKIPLKGHIIIDGGEFTAMNPYGEYELKSFLSPEKNYQVTSGHVANDLEAARAAQRFVKLGKPTILFLNPQSGIIGVESLKSLENLKTFLKNKLNFYGSDNYIIIAPRHLAIPEDIPPGVQDIVKIRPDGTVYYGPEESRRMSREIRRGMPERKPYSIQEPTGEESQTPPKLPKKETPPEELPHSGADVPELLKLAKELSGKEVELGNLRTNLGIFIPGGLDAGQIELNKKIFKNPYLVASVLAHEIGHLTDWLPDHILSRGGLLNRLLSLQNYIRETANPGDKWTPEENKLRRKEYKRRAGLVGNIKGKEFTEELLALASWHRGFQFKGAGPKFESAAELYAEAMSVMLTKPEEFAARAPKFSKAFWANIDAKPEVKQALIDLDELLGGKDKTIVDELDKDIRRMFAKGDELRKQKLAERKLAKVSSFERIRQLLDDKNHQLIKKQENLEKQGVIFPADKNPKYLLEEYALSNNAVYEWCMEVDKQITKDLDAAELSEADLGVLTFLKRIVGTPEVAEEIEPFDEIDIEELDGMIDASTGKTFKASETFKDRKEIANPLGLYPKRAQAQLDHLKASIGEEKYAKLEKIADKFHKLVFSVVEEAVKVGSYNKKVFEERILPNKDTYVAFGVLNYLQNYVPAGVKKQVGTLHEIENPFITTILKTISLIKLNEKQKAANSVRDLLLKYFPGEIAPTKSIKPQGVKIFVNPAPGKGQMKLLEDGKMSAYDVDPYIADSLDRDATALSKEVGNIINTVFGNNMFRQLYITYNPGFAFAFNPIRDFKRAYKSLAALGKGVSVKDLLLEYVKNLPSSYKKLQGINDDLIKEMIHNRALEVNIDDFADTYTSKDKVFNDILIKYRIAKSPQELGPIRRTLLKPVVKLLEFIRFHGSALESISKIAGYSILKNKDVPPAERAYITRNFIGTPNWRKKGLATDTTNAVWMFSNIMKEGMKSDLFLASNPKTRSGYWWATAKMDILPKLLMRLAAAGLFGYGLKRIYDKVSEYDKTNYIIIPIGEMEDGKAVYARIPHDETGRLISALFWKTTGAMSGKPEQLQQIFSFGAGQMPNLAPGIQLATGWSSYLAGKNPYDNFRGRYIIDDTTWKAGGAYSLKKMIQWTMNQTGLLNFATYDKDENTTFESVVQFTPIINRILRVSDYGEQELKNEKKKQRQKIMAQHRLEREEN